MSINRIAGILEYCKGSSRWRGVTAIASGSTSVVVSASLIQSGTPPLLSMGVVSVASHRDLCLSVNSVVAGTSFCIVSNLATVDTLQVVYAIIL